MLLVYNLLVIDKDAIKFIQYSIIYYSLYILKCIRLSYMCGNLPTLEENYYF